MTHLICRVQEFEIVAPYTLRITFDDRTQQVVDFLPVLKGELYGPLRDLALFNQVGIDSEVHTLVWPNGADFDPATLHEWPRSATAFAEMAGLGFCPGLTSAPPARGEVKSCRQFERRKVRAELCFDEVIPHAKPNVPLDDPHPLYRY